ncbi:MAG: hypothetical protein OXC07_06290 [Kistimonas sp.]|nr:hypothetical protein [Kistimonas sp.]
MAIFSTMAACSTAGCFMAGAAIGSFVPFAGAVWGGYALAAAGVGMSVKAATQVGGNAAREQGSIDNLLDKVLATRRIRCLEAVRLTSYLTIAACGAYAGGMTGATVGSALAPWGLWASCLTGICVPVAVMAWPFFCAEQKLIAFMNRLTNPGGGGRAPDPAVPG